MSSAEIVITNKVKCAYHAAVIAMGLRMNLMELVMIPLTSVTVKMVLKGRNVCPAKVNTTKVEMNVFLAIAILMVDQVIHVTLLENVLVVKLDTLETNVSPAKVVTTKVIINVFLAIAIPMVDQVSHVTLLEHVLLVNLDTLVTNVSSAKPVTTEVEINVNVATAIPMDDQVFHVTLLEHVVVNQDTVEANVIPARVTGTLVTTKVEINVKVRKYNS